MRLPSSRVLNSAFILCALAVSVLVARHFTRTGWPLHRANLWLVALSAVVMLAAYAAKAWGWQRLFRHDQRPAVLTLAAAGGAASVGGLALPGRCDDVIRVAIVRRCRRGRVSIRAVVLSLVLLALLDSAAMAPLASVALGLTRLNGWLEAGLAVVIAAGVLAAALVFFLPRLVRRGVLARFRAAAWIADHAASPRDAGWAWAGVAFSWVLRAVAVFVLLAALGLGQDFALAIAFVCAASASAVLPIAPAGAAMQAGAGSAMLVASGMHAEDAVAFGIAAQALLIGVGAACVLALAVWHAHGSLQQIVLRHALARGVPA